MMAMMMSQIQLSSNRLQRQLFIVASSENVRGTRAFAPFCYYSMRLLPKGSAFRRKKWGSAFESDRQRKARKPWKMFNSHRSKKKNQPDWVGFLFLCKGYKKDIFEEVLTGFEPYVFCLSKHPQYVAHHRCLDALRPPT